MSARFSRRHGARAFPSSTRPNVVDPAVRPPFHPVMADGTSAFSDKDSPLSALCAEVGPVGDEPLLVKSEASAFANGELSPLLAALGVEWLFIAGVWTEACIDATVKDAVGRGLRVVLIKDACGSGSIAMHQTGILNLANRLYGGAVTNARDACRLMARETVTAWMVEGSVPLRFTYENAADLYDGL
jgi:maleamate amidohydrolase